MTYVDTSAYDPGTFTSTPTPGSPIVQRLPASISAYKSLSDQLAAVTEAGALDPRVADAMRRLAIQRITRGQAPPGLRELPALLRAGQTLEAQAPAPERGTGPIDMLGNAALDVKDIFTSIPKLPKMVFDSITQLPDAPGLLSDALAKGDFQAASRVPGINLIPGAYTLGNLLEGDTAEMRRHPLMTALDVAPALSAKVFSPASAETLASRVRPAKLGAHLDNIATNTLAEAAAETGRPTLQQMAELRARELGPQPRSILQLIGDQTPIGRLKDNTAARLAATPVSQYIRGGVGEAAKGSSGLASRMTQEVNDVANPNSIIWNRKARNSIFNRENHYNMDVPALEKVFDFERKYATADGITAASNGAYTSVDQWQPRRELISVEMQKRSIADLQADPNVALQPWEADMIHQYRDTIDQIVAPYTADHALHPKADTKSFAWVEYGDGTGRKELLPIAQARKVEISRNAERYAQQAQRAGASTDPADMLDPATLKFLNDRSIPASQRTNVLNGYLWSLRDNGIDIAPVIRDIRNRVSSTDIIDTLNKKITEPVTYTLQDIVDTYTRYDRNGRRIGIKPPPDLIAFHELVKNGYYTDAWKHLNTYFLKTKRAGTLPPELAALDMERVKATLSDYQKRAANTRELNAYGKLTKSLTKRREVVEARMTPARYFPKVKEAASARMVDLAYAISESLGYDAAAAAELQRFVTEEQLPLLESHLRAAHEAGVTKAELLDATGAQLYPKARPDTPLPPSVSDIFNDFAGDASRSWQEWKAEGLDPTFVHAVDPDKGLAFARITPRPVTPGQIKARTFDFAPLSNDLVVGMSHQMTEWLVKKASDRYVDVMVNGSAEYGFAPFTATVEELTTHFRPIAEIRAARYGTTVGKETTDLINAQFAPFAPNEYVNFPRPRGAQYPQQLYVDKAVKRTIEEMSKPMKVSAMVDPVMGIFRTSVLTLSPRWQIYNVLGNAMFLTVGSGLGWTKHFGEAREAMKYMSEASHDGVPPAVMDKLSDGIRLQLSQHPRELAEMQFRSGVAMGRLFKGDVPQFVGQASKSFEAFTTKLVSLNGYVDDMARLMTYLEAYDRLGGGTLQAGEAAASITAKHPKPGSMGIQNEAEAAVRKLMYSWDNLTPFERTTMRYIFPFYGFMSHVGRFAYRYAVDHPVRMAFTASFARNEMQDWSSGLPERLRSMLMFTHDDGSTTGVNLSGWNPFGDVANMLSLTGWLSQVNPIFSTLAEQFGLDPRTGEANLYPSSQYNPETGRLELKTRNPVTALVENLIPQSQLVTNALGLNDNISSLERSDPDAAQRLKLSSFGVPNLWREVDLPGEAMKAEGARRNALSQAGSDMLKSPNTPTPYPVLEHLRTQLLELQASNPDALTKYTPARIADIQQGILTNVPQ